METSFQTTSFMPKKPISQDIAKKDKGANIFTVISIFILIGVIVISVLIYLWFQKTTAELSTLKEQIKLTQERFDPTTLENLKSLDRKINNADKLLSNHLILSPIFKNVLNSNTLKKIQYTNFSYTKTGAGQTSLISINLEGKAETLPYVALQSKKLAENRYIQNIIFSDIVTNKDNSVTFNLSFDINPDLVLFSKVVKTDEIINNNLDNS
jgi:hypothetical protein